VRVGGLINRFESLKMDGEDCCARLVDLVNDSETFQRWTRKMMRGPVWLQVMDDDTGRRLQCSTRVMLALVGCLRCFRAFVCFLAPGPILFHLGRFAFT
jgi:hypothetical protein